MKAQEFEAGYAERSGLSAADLHRLGLRAAPCDCGDESCEGWQMSSTATGTNRPTEER